MSVENIDTGTDELLCRIEDGVGVITFNRPEARNALSDNLSPALRSQVAALGENDDVGAVLITGAGTAFCAGGDVKGMGGRSTKKKMTPPEAIADLIDRQRRMTGAIVGLRKPSIAALPGPAVGAGLSVALSCDIRIAAASAFLSTGYARIGLSGDYGIAWLLTRLIGTSRAREYMYTSERIPAERAADIGLVNRVVPDDKLQEESLSFAKQLAAGPSAAFALMKDNLDDALDQDFGQALVSEANAMIKAARTQDHREAVEAFVQKRQPTFKGR